VNEPLNPATHPDAVEHRRDDRELLGWIIPSGDDRWVACDRLGRRISGDVDWLEAEEALDDRGIHWLAEPFSLELEDGVRQRVRLTRVSAAGLTAVDDDWGAAAVAGLSMRTHELPFPAPDSLREGAP
jgi:hypothetical protein